MNPAPIPPDPLDRAVFALRTAETPAGPGPDVLSRTLAALEAADARPIPFTQPRKRPMLANLTRIAAAVLALAGGAAYVASTRPASAAVLLQEVARKLHDARTLSFRQAISLPGADPVIFRVFYREPGRTRTEMPNGEVMIADATRGETLILDPAARTATQIRDRKGETPENAVEAGALAMLRSLRDLAPREGKRVGDRVIGGVTARGFRVPVEGATLTIWVDPEAQIPVEVETELPSMPDAGQRVTLSDIVLNPEVADAQFALAVPAGYQVKAAESDEIEPEAAVAEILRRYAAGHDGQFPATLGDVATARSLLAEARKAAGPPADDIRLFGSLGVIGTFPFTLPNRVYRPDGAKLGDRDRAVFWYPIEGTAKFKAVYGDLHVAEVAADQLPK